MRTPQHLLLLLACLLGPVSLSAQESSPPASTSALPSASDPQVVALVQRALGALTGGVAVTDITLAGSAHRIAGSDDETGTIIMRATAAGDSRIDLTLPSGDNTEIRNHSAIPLPNAFPQGISLVSAIIGSPQPAGAWSGADGVIHGLHANNLLTDPTWFFPGFTLTRIASGTNYTLSYVGQETISGQSVLHVSAMQQFSNLSNGPTEVGKLLQHLSQLDIDLDLITLLPKALRFTTHPDNNANIDIGTVVQFSDYRLVDGVEVPFRIQKFVNENLTLDIQLNSSDINTDLSRAHFQFQ